MQLDDCREETHGLDFHRIPGILWPIQRKGWLPVVAFIQSRVPCMLVHQGCFSLGMLAHLLMSSKDPAPNDVVKGASSETPMCQEEAREMKQTAERVQVIHSSEAHKRRELEMKRSAVGCTSSLSALPLLVFALSVCQSPVECGCTQEHCHQGMGDRGCARRGVLRWVQWVVNETFTQAFYTVVIKGVGSALVLRPCMTSAQSVRGLM